MIKKLAFVCFLIWLFLASAGCTEAPATFGPLNYDALPPPDLTWDVRNQDTAELKQYDAGVSLRTKRGEKYEITLTATEADGVHLIELNPSGSGEMVWKCAPQEGDESLWKTKTLPLESKSESFYPPHPFTASAKLTYELNFEMQCSDPSWKFVSGTAKLTGHALSSAWSEVIEVLEFRVSP